MKYYQLDFLTPGNSHKFAFSLKHILDISKSPRYHLVLHVILHTLKNFVANFGVLQSAIALKYLVFNFFAFAILDFLAIFKILKIKIYLEKGNHISSISIFVDSLLDEVVHIVICKPCVLTTSN